MPKTLSLQQLTIINITLRKFCIRWLRQSMFGLAKTFAELVVFAG